MGYLLSTPVEDTGSLILKRLIMGIDLAISRIVTEARSLIKLAESLSNEELTSEEQTVTANEMIKQAQFVHGQAYSVYQWVNHQGVLTSILEKAYSSTPKPKKRVPNGNK